MIPPLKIQIFTRAFPGDSYTGAKRYLIEFLTYLNSSGFNVELIMIGDSPGERSSIFFIQSDVHKIAKIHVRNNKHFGKVLFRYKKIKDWLLVPVGFLYCLIKQKNDKLLDYIDNIVKKTLKNNYSNSKKLEPHNTYRDSLLSPAELEFAFKHINRFDPDVVVANYVWLAGLFDMLPSKKILKVILTHEVIHQRVDIALKHNIDLNYSNWTWDKESILLNKADILLAISQEDSLTFKKMAPSAKVLYLPMPMRAHNQDLSRKIPYRCLFVGASGQTNSHGLKWFLDNSWPIIIEKLPDTTLHICGSVFKEIKNKYQNVVFKGIVQNLTPEYAQAQLCIIPLLIGSGLKIKVVEALANGCACVSTSTGAQGLKDLIDKAIKINDNAVGFANLIIFLLNHEDEIRKMEDFAKDYVRKKLSPDFVYRNIIQIMRSTKGIAELKTESITG